MDPLLDTAPFGFLVLRDDGYVETVNRTLAEMLEAKVEGIAGHHVDRLFTAASRIFYQSHIFPTLKLQGSVHEVYLTLTTAKGGEVPVLLNATRRETPEGPRSDWALTAMRQRNEYENEILQARRLAEEAARIKDRFLSFLSHELRSPLSAIKGWTSILARAPADAEKVKRGVEVIERNTDLQLKLVDDLLDHASLASGKLRVELSPVDLRTTLQMVLDTVQGTALVKGVAVERAIAPEALRVSADAERLQQIFWNLLNNAVKFTPAGGRVRASARRADQWIEVVVEDNGKGIAADFLPYVFESFRQEEGRVTRAEGGLGLGMAITRQLVELHGGSIGAASLGPGCGSTFTLRLPGMPSANGSMSRKEEASPSG